MIFSVWLTPSPVMLRQIGYSSVINWYICSPMLAVFVAALVFVISILSKRVISISLDKFYLSPRGWQSEKANECQMPDRQTGIPRRVQDDNTASSDKRPACFHGACRSHGQMISGRRAYTR